VAVTHGGAVLAWGWGHFGQVKKEITSPHFTQKFSCVGSLCDSLCEMTVGLTFEKICEFGTGHISQKSALHSFCTVNIAGSRLLRKSAI